MRNSLTAPALDLFCVLHFKDVLWLRNDGSGEFGQPIIVDTAASSTSFTYADDVNGDGRVDILATLEDKIVWYENLDEAVFGPRRIVHQFQSPRSFFSGDIDGDGDADVVANTSLINDTLAWYENIDGNGKFGPRQVIGRHIGARVAPADLDNDGHLDLLVMSNPAVGGVATKIGLSVAWYENTDGKGLFAFAETIESDADSVAIGDLDGDGDVDALLGSYQFDRITWRENTDGVATFGLQHEITASAYRFRSVDGIDMDNDGDTDILLNSLRNTFETHPVKQPFDRELPIHRARRNWEWIHSIDVDGDGDDDILGTTLDQIRWFESRPGQGKRLMPQKCSAVVLIPCRVVAAAHGAGANDRLPTREALARRADEELPVLTRSISAPLEDDS